MPPVSQLMLKTKNRRSASESRDRSAVRLDPDSAEAGSHLRQAQSLLVSCSVCPRQCGVARLEGEVGFCRAGSDLIIASSNLHFGEEPPISGSRGSGTIFFSGCSLRCMYCQNYPISQQAAGRVVGVDDLSSIMLGLERSGAHNINFVTPTHFAPQILEATLSARRQGLSVPIVWNTSGYERVGTLRLLEGIVDVYLADMRYGEKRAGERFSQVKDYPKVNRAAIAEMHRQVGELTLDVRGVAQRGLLVRHLVLPGGNSASAAVFKYLAEEISPRTALSLMSQYFPAYRAPGDPVLGRRLTRAEYEEAVLEFERSGLVNGYCQALFGG